MNIRHSRIHNVRQVSMTTSQESQQSRIPAGSSTELRSANAARRSPVAPYARIGAMLHRGRSTCTQLRLCSGARINRGLNDHIALARKGLD